MSNEQWKENGVCTECRRQNYCGHACTAHKRMKQAMFAKFAKMRNNVVQTAETMKEEGKI